MTQAVRHIGTVCSTLTDGTDSTLEENRRAGFQVDFVWLSVLQCRAVRLGTAVAEHA